MISRNVRYYHAHREKRLAWQRQYYLQVLKGRRRQVSMELSQRFEPVPLAICPNCHKTFKATPEGTIGRRKRWCSNECRWRANVRINRQRKRRWDPEQPRNCRLCLREFMPRAAHQIWCSKSCRNRANLTKFRGRHNANYYARYRDKLLAYQREYYAKNAERRRDWARAHRARLKVRNVIFEPIVDMPTLYD